MRFCGQAVILLGLALGAGGFSTPLRAQLIDPNSEQGKRQTELQGIQDTLKASEEQRRKIEAEIEATRADREKLNSALIDANEKVQSAEGKIHASEVRLDTMKGSEEAIRLSLESRRGVIGEVLAALQRMGRSPPPAILVRPQDMLEAVRTAMLLGAVLPDLKAEVEALSGDLNELVRLKTAIANEKATFEGDLANLAGERLRLTALIDARQASLNSAEEALGAERDRASELAKQATSLKDLITGAEQQSAGAAKAAEAARKADADQMAKMSALEASKLGVGALPPPFKDKGRTAPALPFSEVKGMLPLPVAGELVKKFGEPDGLGGAEKGLSLGTRPGASVATPTDGWILYAGPFRSYGQLLIIDVGGGYYVLLAGMDRINVRVGQFVQVGEPVAVMGDGSLKTASAVALGAAGPILYVEFRKDGGSIDPSPWWAKSSLEKVRG